MDITEELLRRRLNTADKYYDKLVKEFTDKEKPKVISELFEDGGYIREYIVQEIQEGIFAEVYGSYGKPEPAMYHRRYDSGGGLADPENIVTEVVNNGGRFTIKITNNATGNPAYSPTDGKLEDIILSGGPYNYKEGYMIPGTFRGPRNYYSKINSEWNHGALLIEKVREILEGMIDPIVDDLYMKAYDMAVAEEGGV